MITREDCIKIGEVSKTHNLQGAVIITTDCDLLEQYADEPVFLLLEGAPVPFFIAEDGLTVRNHTSYIVKFDYVNSLAKAERLVGCEVLIEKELLEDEDMENVGYDVYDLIELEVRDEVSGAAGRVVDVADYSGNVVLTISILGKEILLPLSEMYVHGVDFEQGLVDVHIPSELAELNCEKRKVLKNLVI
ncbi:MAG: ribosome maturation factor RimM [Odoribacter sp.]|nr:ribosome maturation factor RimM [Odoribacter sp.]MDY3033869.1 ribosome maturation factor RimM [Odoribacter sp.]